MRKVLFIDRDGTIIKETADEQIDAFEKMMFYPKVFTFLGKIAKELDYELVMITNQDGLGTDSFPEETFWPVQNFILKSFENEGVVFDKVFLDRTFPHENADTRKPETGLLTEYFSEDYDLANSFVIGDRLTDMELAKNLGAKGIFINDNTNLGSDEITVKREALNDVIVLENNDWENIYEFLKLNLYPEKLEGDEPEELEVVPWPISDLLSLTTREDCTEGRTIAALYIARDYLAAEKFT